MTDFRSLIDCIISSDHSRRMKILDLGSGLIDYKCEILLLNYRQSVHYTAVDSKSPFSIFSCEMNDDVQSHEQVSVNDWIQKINHLIKYNESVKFKKISEEEFNEIFRFEFSKDAVEFCMNKYSREKYDLIIISNLLHFINRQEADRLVDMCIEMLNQNGLLYICVLRSEQVKYQRINLYCIDDFELLKERLQRIELMKITPFHFELIGRKIAAYNSGLAQLPGFLQI